MLDAAHTLLELSVIAQDDASTSKDLKREKACCFYRNGQLEKEKKSTKTENIDQENKLIKEELNRLTMENQQLKKKIRSNEFSKEAFENDDSKVKYYTGLPNFLVLMALFNLIQPYITETGQSSLTKLQKLLMVLIRLRLNSPLQDLAYRFNTSRATVSRVFLIVIDILYQRLKGFILWPEREQLRKTMPMEFRKYFGFKVAVIIDCFEIFIERPSNLLARASTWSSYKHHNTVKFLIGITPQGVISFLSDAWGGRASDKHIANSCGFLKNLLPGDVVLADRGFDIDESVGLMCAEVKIPAFTKGKSQLSPLEIEMTRKIAHNRIHVERVIGLVRNKFTILQGTLPVDYLLSDGNVPTVDKIVSVCCALTNMCKSVVPFD